MKPGKAIPLVAAALVVLGVVGGTFVLRGGSNEGVVDEAGGSEGKAMPEPALSTAPQAARPVATPVVKRPVEDQMIGHVERRARMRDMHRERLASMREQSAQRFASEQVDPAWAPGKTTELSNLAEEPEFQAAAAQPQRLDIECRSSMCRIEGQFKDTSTAEDWILLYTASVGSALPNSVVSRTRNPDGTTRVQIYGRAR